MNTQVEIAEPTLKQAMGILNLVPRGKDRDGMQALFESGLLSDLFKVDATKIDRYKFRRFLGLESEIIVVIEYALTVDAMCDKVGISWERPKVERPIFHEFKRPEAYADTIGVSECRLFETPPGKRLFTREDADEMVRNADPENPWRPAELEELIMFAELYHTLQLTCVVMAFGSTIKERYMRDEDIRDGFPCLVWPKNEGEGPRLSTMCHEYRNEASQPAFKSGGKILATREIR